MDYYTAVGDRIAQGPPETITAVTIKYGEALVIAPRPKRHHDIIAAVYETWGKPTDGDCPQGFMTSRGRFVDREEALAIATAAGQIVEKRGNPNILFSEDLW